MYSLKKNHKFDITITSNEVEVFVISRVEMTAALIETEYLT